MYTKFHRDWLVSCRDTTLQSSQGAMKISSEKLSLKAGTGYTEEYLCCDLPPLGVMMVVGEVVTGPVNLTSLVVNQHQWLYVIGKKVWNKQGKCLATWQWTLLKSNFSTSGWSLVSLDAVICSDSGDSSLRLQPPGKLSIGNGFYGLVHKQPHYYGSGAWVRGYCHFASTLLSLLGSMPSKDKHTGP